MLRILNQFVLTGIVACYFDPDTGGGSGGGGSDDVVVHKGPDNKTFELPKWVDQDYSARIKNEKKQLEENLTRKFGEEKSELQKQLDVVNTKLAEIENASLSDQQKREKEYDRLMKENTTFSGQAKTLSEENKSLKGRIKGMHIKSAVMGAIPVEAAEFAKQIEVLFMHEHGSAIQYVEDGDDVKVFFKDGDKDVAVADIMKTFIEANPNFVGNKQIPGHDSRKKKTGSGSEPANTVQGVLKTALEGF